jgi:hypothetical protein
MEILPLREASRLLCLRYQMITTPSTRTTTAATAPPVIAPTLILGLGLKKTVVKFDDMNLMKIGVR